MRTRYVSATIAALIVAALVEYLFGRVLICTCGYVKLWHGEVWSSENSQHLSDWYTLSHVIHGFALYYLGRFAARKRLFWAFVLALAVETSWEIVENSSFIIERYRQTTMSLDYFGDSIVNSVSDIAAMVLGFTLASRLRFRTILLLAILMELLAAIVIRDNLILNIIMLIYPLEVIRRWQMGG